MRKSESPVHKGLEKNSSYLKLLKSNPVAFRRYEAKLRAENTPFPRSYQIKKEVNGS